MANYKGAGTLEEVVNKTLKELLNECESEQEKVALEKIISMALCLQKHENLSKAYHENYIGVCFIDEPFITDVWGNFTTEELKKIEQSLIDDDYGFNDRYKQQSTEYVKFKVIYNNGETQYGNGYGDIYTIEPYFELEEICIY